MRGASLAVASLAVVGLLNVADAYLGFVPCSENDSPNAMCRGLVYETDVTGTRLLTPHSWFYYPAHALLVLPTSFLVGSLVFGLPRDRRPGVASGIALALAFVITFVVALTFTRIAFR